MRKKVSGLATTLPSILCLLSLAECTSDGSAKQTCTYHGKTYPYEVTFRSADGCNECWCMGGQPTAICTAMACRDAGMQGAPCNYDGTSYPTGATFPSTDGCNTCECLWFGEPACTLKACVGDGGFSGEALPAGDATASSCVYNGTTYPLDVYFKAAADGCNSCHCRPDGQVMCTLITDCGHYVGPQPMDAPSLL